MPATSATAYGKIILFGEHAVVYGHPAIAIPVTNVSAKAIVTANPGGNPDQIVIDAPNINMKCDIDSLPKDHPFSRLISEIIQRLGVKSLPSFNLRIKSSIPIAAGLGSGAAVSISAIRAITEFVGSPLDTELVSNMAFEIEKIYHGTPSGIDNTVIAYEQPIYFIKNYPFEVLSVAEPFFLVIADSGLQSRTSYVVNQVKTRWENNPALYDQMFNEIGEVSKQSREFIINGPVSQLGNLMNKNQSLLLRMGVSNDSLENLIKTAINHGAMGAKLSGAGQGGNIIALVSEKDAGMIAEKLLQAGAVNTIITQVKPA